MFCHSLSTKHGSSACSALAGEKLTLNVPVSVRALPPTCGNLPSTMPLVLKTQKKDTLRTLLGVARVGFLEVWVKNLPTANDINVGMPRKLLTGGGVRGTWQDAPLPSLDVKMQLVNSHYKEDVA